MEVLVQALQWVLAVPVVSGSAFALLTVPAAWLFRRRRSIPLAPEACSPVSLLKPVCGQEKRLEENLRSCCEQDHPDFQVVFSVQHKEDSTLPLLYRLQAEYGPARVAIAIAERAPMPNGKIHNLVGAMPAVRHEQIVISDSDIEIPPSYLRRITAPLRDPGVGYVCTPYKGVHAERWYERLELLSLHDYTTQVVFAWMTGASGFLLGGSVAFRRSELDAIGGFEALHDYLVEDYEMGQRMTGLGLRPAFLPDLVETVIDLPDRHSWWRHMVYWDQNTRAARPLAFIATILIRSLPAALALAALRGFDAVGVTVLATALAIRWGTVALTARAFGDVEAMRNLGWLPLRDLAALGSWLTALRARELEWRGLLFDLDPDGRLSPRDPAAVAVGTSEDPAFRGAP